MSVDGFWTGKSVFLTGHTGFKGGWLALWLSMLGARVTGYALPPGTAPCLYEAAGVADAVDRSILADICDRDALARAFADAKPEIVLHLAAQPLVRLSYDDPVGTYMTNVMGTVHVLEEARRHPGVRAVLVVTSDKCYENPEWVWGCREHDPMGGHDPYSSSKGCTELVTSSYRRAFYTRRRADGSVTGLASARAGNVIGGGDWARDRLIPDIVRAVGQGQSVAIRNPAAVRPWQHVLEPLSGYMLLTEKLWQDQEKFAGGWNFGPRDHDALPVRDVADMFCGRIGKGAKWHHEHIANAPHEAHLLRLDIAKARSLLGWEPRWSLVTGIAMTASWYRAFLDGADMRQVTREQIAAFDAAAPKTGSSTQLAV